MIVPVGRALASIALGVLSLSGEAHNPPTFSTTPVTEAADGEPYEYVAAASDPDGLPVSISAPSLPAWLTLTDNGDGTARLAGTPAQGDVGDHAVTLVADNGTSTAEQAFTVTVADVDYAPVAARDSVGTPEDVAVVVRVLDNDSDPDGDPLTVAGSEPGSYGTTTTDGTTVTYTPAPDFVGADAFTYVLSDGTSTAVGTVVVTVAGRNDAPTPADDAVETDEDTAVTVAVLANDTDADAGTDLVVTAVSEPSNGMATLNEDGTVTYAPDPDYFGTDSFTYTVDDGGGPVDAVSAPRRGPSAEATATVTVTVRSVNDAPVAPPVTFPADGETYTFVRDGEPRAFGVSWPAGTDPDGSPSYLSYRWEAATTTAFDPVAIEVDLFVGTTQFSGTSSWVHDLLDRLGVGEAGSATLYQRVVVSDAEGGVTAGPVTTFTFERIGGVSSEPAPDAFAHLGAYPNPTAGRLAVVVDLAERSEVRLDVYDLLGRRVAGASSASVPAGAAHRVDVDLSALGPGIYSYRLTATSGRGVDMATGQATVAR